MMFQDRHRLKVLIVASILVGWLLVTKLSGADSKNFFKPDMEVKVLGLVCSSCGIGLKNSFKRHDKVSALKMNTQKQILLLDFKEGKEGAVYYIKNKEVIRMVEKAGYEVESIKILADRKPNRYNKP
jgi:cation transport ATPase